LIERALLGEEIVITQAGRPVAKLVPIPPPVRTRQPGSAKGAFIVPADFDVPLPAAVIAEWGSTRPSTS
jgi:antitoxin (DNA-binding transcriptional repressor) of toxin-antitoxin stability system